MEHAEKVFISIAKQYDTVEEITSALRNLVGAGELTDEEYNYLDEQWDNLLMENGLY